MYKDILISVKGRVATIRLNRPAVSNALAKGTYGEIRDAVQSLEQDDSVGCIVLTGEGKNFSAGGDIVRFKELIDTKAYLNEADIDRAAEMSKAIRLCRKPVIAMINGFATGSGLSAALACDFRTGTAKSRLVMAFIKMGLSGDTGSIYFLNKLLGASVASELIMTGRPVGGEEAYRLGLLNRLIEEGQLEEETYRFAEQLANAPLYAIARQKELINTYFYGDLDRFTQMETTAMAACSKTRDFEEAVNAFLEKRSPHFVGQ